jgi:hypothetical protein
MYIKPNEGFFRGVGSSLSLFPARRPKLRVFYAGHEIGEGTVEQALQNDWEIVGADLIAAIQEVDPDGRRHKSIARRR